MVGSAYKSVLTSLAEVLLKPVVGARRTFCRLNHHEAQRIALDIAVAQLVPVNLALIVRDVYAVYLVAGRIVGVAEECTPAKSGRTDEVGVESPNIYAYHHSRTCPPYGTRMA